MFNTKCHEHPSIASEVTKSTFASHFRKHDRNKQAYCVHLINFVNLVKVLLRSEDQGIGGLEDTP
jgi:hypothetical protein